MLADLPTPWFDSALERLELRKGNRVLAIEPDPREVAALRSAIGNAGELTVTLRDRQTAERLAERPWPNLRVLAHEVDGGETFGTFDSALIAPHTGPLLPVARYAALLRANLRPGGRFVVDLPAADMLPDLRAAILELGWDEERLAPITGPSDVELVEALREAGLRSVQSALGSHLLRTLSPADLAAGFADALALQDGEVAEIGHAIVRRRQDPGPLEALVHRAQVTGQR
ncbi:MAG: hypothetical protein KAI24_13100 [Planctomycetes bacterium]|nr:hypothetical protein [Planctomycetota bacterium]